MSYRPKVVLALLVAAVAAGLFAVDLGLKHMEDSELHGEAAHAFSEGSRLLALHSNPAALERLQHAYSLERRNSIYAVELVAAWMANGSYPQAEALLEDVLRSDPNNGRANLLAARLMSATSRWPDAIPYYHRAIYGTWPGDQARERVRTRLEFIQALRDHGREREILSEVLALQGEGPDDPEMQKLIAGLFLVADSPSRAAALYRQLIRHSPNDASLDEGLGQAELALGDFRAAQIAFLSAFSRSPAIPGLQQRIELSGSLAALDPTPRRLSSAEKLRRSQEVLLLAQGEAADCLPQPLPTQPEPLKTAVTNEAAEHLLSLAAQLWRDVQKSCPARTSARSEKLRLLMRKLEA